MAVALNWIWNVNVTTISRTLKCLSLLDSAGAIALAEFLLESASSVYLSPTVNTTGLSGVMALRKGEEQGGAASGRGLWEGVQGLI